ncbi:Mobile element protein [Microbacterium esteraromaticum]|uniref:Mobile element protein n=1 Tax=Microbacterium esteraromaticum TaxID=57043 RepID=A0A1R4J7B9_9MICO|nr:Mobile element protein [Microbacterium esteraromaticum]
MKGSYTLHPRDLDLSDATVGERSGAFARPDLTTFCRLDELDLVVTGQRLEPARAVLACRVLTPDEWFRRCGAEGAARDTVIR